MRFYIFTILIIFSLSFFALSAMAAKLELNSSVSEIGTGQQFQIDLMLDAEADDINAAKGTIIFPEELLELKEIRDGNSVIGFWVEKPVLEEGKIKFSGTIPGGFRGVLSPYRSGYGPGKVFSLIFSAKKEGGGVVEIHDAKVLLNDGAGTPIKTTIFNFQFSISPPTGDLPKGDKSQIPEDIGSPELFIPEVASDPNIFNGKWFLVFAAQDKNSGIDRYEVQEAGNKEPAETGWTKAESPHVLKDQGLGSYIFVRAIDKAGNVRTVFLSPKYPAWYKMPIVDITIGLIIVIVILLSGWIRKHIVALKTPMRRIFKFFGFLIFAAFLFGLAFSSEAAILYFSPSEGQYYQNENFTVNVLASAETAVNAVQGTVMFPTEYLEAIKIEGDGTGSIIDLWIQRPSFSNAGQSGNVNFGGVVLNPGFIGSEGKIIGIIFRIKNSGSANLSFSNFSVMANDGLGTNVASQPGTADFTLLPPRQLPPTSAQKDLKIIVEQVTSLKEKFEKSGAPGSQNGSILRLWNILPRLVQIGILALVGAATLALFLITVSFGVIVLIWLWSHVWYRKEDFVRWLRKLVVFMRLAKKEFAGDIKYAVKELNRDVLDAKERPAFQKIFKNYWLSIWKIIRRFFTWNRIE